MQVWYESNQKKTLSEHPGLVIGYDENLKPITVENEKDIPSSLWEFWDMKGFTLHEPSLHYTGTGTLGA